MRYAVLLLACIGCNTGLHAQRIYATISGGDLYVLDVANCSSQFIGSTGIGFGDLAFTPNGTLFGCVNGEIWEVDTATAAVTFRSNITVLGVTMVALNDTALLVEANAELFGFNPLTGVSWSIGIIGQASPGDLTWFGDDLYMTGNGLVRIELNATATAIDNVVVLNQGALNFPGCEAMATSWTTWPEQVITGFHGADAYAYCHVDGTFTLLCDDILVGGTPGAAGPRLPLSPAQNGCADPLGISTLAPQPEVLTIVPNPATDVVNISGSSAPFVRLELFDTDGRCVHRLDNIRTNGVIIQHGLAPGSYVCRITGHDGSVTSASFLVLP